MRRQLVPALAILLVFTVLTALVYPLAVTGLAQTAFRGKANGSLIERDGDVVGSSLIGQPFTRLEYFHPRPSAAADGYDAVDSSGTNLGPTNPELLGAIGERVTAYRKLNDLPPETEVPVDAATASSSGLDPHISLANARLQAPRVAEVRGLDLDVVLALIDDHIEGRSLGVLGEPGVNVLELNLTLDEAAR